MDPRSGVKANVSRQSLTDNQNHGHSLSHVMRYTKIRNAIRKNAQRECQKSTPENRTEVLLLGGGMVNNIDFDESNCDSPKIKEFYNLLCFKLKRPCTDAIINM